MLLLIRLAEPQNTESDWKCRRLPFLYASSSYLLASRACIHAFLRSSVEVKGGKVKGKDKAFYLLVTELLKDGCIMIIRRS